MEQLVKLVQERTGISEEQATQAVTTVFGFIKERLPEPLAAQLDGVLKGDVDLKALTDQAQGMMGMLGGFLGKKDGK